MARIELDIDTNLNMLDLSRREADVAVRVRWTASRRTISSTPHWPSAIDAVYGRPAYLEAHDPLDPA